LCYEWVWVEEGHPPLSDRGGDIVVFLGGGGGGHSH